MLLELLSGLLSAAVLSGAASAESDLGAAVQNPISSLINVPLKFTFDNGAANGDAGFLNIQPVNLRTEDYYNVVRPAGGPEWTIGFTVQFLFPKS
ncbi:MAG: hypothetical protein JKP98_14315 [Rhodobacteraceae bacterium]|jgi:hypothetical protein|nr:MAG: hypothetical protein N838_19705 [Thiohalocapsa sp. PB-PSB1]MBL4541707.1 hypothetical protein [Paracoccaceae bacterium]MBL4557847.1 hypothetical protein [Paracoccaceae bacterium]